MFITRPDPVNYTNTNDSYQHLLKHNIVNHKHKDIEKPNENINSNIQLKKLVPYEIRLENYIKKRAEIFKNENVHQTNKTTKIRDRYQKRKQERKEINSTIISDENDIRPYLDVTINGVKLKGLMDSGASISCLGDDCLQIADQMKIPVLDFKSSVHTADGKTHQIIGKVKAKVQCGDKDEEIILYLIPNLKQKLILGYDSWQRLGINICINPTYINEIATDNLELNVHELTSEQLTLLENVKQSFRCYTKYGLGKTHLETHTIDILCRIGVQFTSHNPYFTFVS